MLKIRLQRIGRKNDPAFRVIVTESARGAKSGNHIELLGSHNPRQHTTNLKPERIKYWISKGAQVSGTVHNLLVNEKVVEGKKVNVLPRKSPIVKDTTEEVAEEKAGDSGDEAVPPAAPSDEAVEKTPEVPAKEAPATPPADEEKVAEEAPAEGKDEEKPAVQ